MAPHMEGISERYAGKYYDTPQVRAFKNAVDSSICCIEAIQNVLGS